MDFTKLNQEQLKAATFNGKHLLVLAGAGTGKTINADPKDIKKGRWLRQQLTTKDER